MWKKVSDIDFKEGFYWYRESCKDGVMGKERVVAVSMSYLNGKECGWSVTEFGWAEINEINDYKGDFSEVSPPNSELIVDKISSNQQTLDAIALWKEAVDETNKALGKNDVNSLKRWFGDNLHRINAVIA